MLSHMHGLVHALPDDSNDLNLLDKNPLPFKDWRYQSPLLRPAGPNCPSLAA